MKTRGRMTRDADRLIERYDSCRLRHSAFRRRLG